jgi:SAM-dependent methyltransferase
MPSDSGYNAHPELAELYDSVPLYKSRRDVDFYVDLCRQAGDALELGCGTGRILIPAAQAGCFVTGLDHSKNMLARCRAKADALSNDARHRITLVEADITRFRLSRTFKLAIAPFRPIQHLMTVGEQPILLQCVREHPDAGGTLVFDVFDPSIASRIRSHSNRIAQGPPKDMSPPKDKGRRKDIPLKAIERTGG